MQRNCEWSFLRKRMCLFQHSARHTCMTADFPWSEQKKKEQIYMKEYQIALYLLINKLLLNHQYDDHVSIEIKTNPTPSIFVSIH